MAACGPGPSPASSTTRSPAIGPATAAPPVLVSAWPCSNTATHPTSGQATAIGTASRARRTAQSRQASASRSTASVHPVPAQRVGQPQVPLERAVHAEPRPGGQQHVAPAGGHRRTGWRRPRPGRSTGSAHPPAGTVASRGTPAPAGRAGGRGPRRSSTRRAAEHRLDVGQQPGGHQLVQDRPAEIHRRPGRGRAGGPSAAEVRIQPTRNPPQAILLAEPTVSTSGESTAPCAASGRGGGPSRASSASDSSTSSVVPVRRASSTSRARPAASSRAPVGFWKSGIR